MKTFLLLLLLSLAACAPEQVKDITQQSGVDFTTYKTYNFMDVNARNEAAFEGPGTGIETLKQAVSREMTRRGYQQSDSPDLLVNIGVVIKDKTQTRQTTIQEAPLYIGQRNYRWQSQEVATGTYEEGTATIEVVDAARNELIWEGSVASILTPKPDKLTKRINDAIRTLFDKYPVPPRG
ncbi:DUF4136 domain-containing protein [Hymenobacter sp. HDW8]|uniref:DUF4136 domain-containing protein n=1 Tax=Hymenobacter sp. HDW8 TaxID=2714932 RepID=UPI00140CA3DD|nr:DUF4136 domain-containing protein [Hymenobacter sp. HDW8]QIL75237.1 DUF4136 domain-containing protein [Hymenobacter sp. HDW8]